MSRELREQEFESSLSLCLQKLESLDTSEVAFKEFTRLLRDNYSQEAMKKVLTKMQQLFSRRD